MAQLYDYLKTKSKYYDKKNFNTQQQYDQAVRASSTVYVGNLAYDCTQDSIKQLFGRAGKVKRIIMGINDGGIRCGFCFVIYETHQEAERAVEYVTQTKLHDKPIRVDLDPGYKEGREKGRGKDGNQKRDDFRNKIYDDSRGKYNNRYDKRDRDDRGYGGRDRYQRNDRARGQRDQTELDQQRGPRHMSRKEMENKEEEEY